MKNTVSAAIGVILVGACIFVGLAGTTTISLSGPLRIDVSGLPLNLVLPLSNATGAEIYGFVLTILTASDSKLPTFYAVAVQPLGRTEGAPLESGDYDVDFDVDDNRNGMPDGNAESNNTIEDEHWWNVIRTRVYRDALPPMQEFQLRIEGGSADDTDGSRYDVFPAGTTLVISPCNDANGAVFLRSP